MGRESRRYGKAGALLPLLREDNYLEEGLFRGNNEALPIKGISTCLAVNSKAKKGSWDNKIDKGAYYLPAAFRGCSGGIF